jgi:glucose/arabinose dehydrogenase
MISGSTARQPDRINGKILRLTDEGKVPPDNPFVGRRDAKPEIWSYGHRNSQGAALNPSSGKLWMHEHGPRGGDEINIPQAGKNYGWPVIGFGIDYSGAKIHEGTSKPGMEQPIRQWTPVIAPSGMAFYTGDKFPGWRRSFFVGGLRQGEIPRTGQIQRIVGGGFRP